MIKSSRELTLKDLNLLFYGPPGSGKTFVAASASKYWPEVLEKVNTWTTLKDLLSISVDAGATDGLAQYKLEVPSISFTEVMKETGSDVAESIRKITAEAKKHIELVNKTESDTWIVVDTISMLDRYFTDFYEPLSKDGYKCS